MSFSIRGILLGLALFSIAGTGSSRAQDAAPQVLHISDQLANLPSAQVALEDFKLNKTITPNLKANATDAQQSIGSRATFRVMKNVVTDPTWEEKSFTLTASSNVADLWVEDNELALGHVNDDDITALESALLFATPVASVDPANGIVENNNTYFGESPDVDGDGKLDILLYDISEGGTNNNYYVAGFVTPSDLSFRGGGNNKDVLYLDTHPGVSSRPINSLLATAAHEYQHLIHYNYDGNEQIFINEGLSEWAEVLNGYPARSMSFLEDPSTYNIRLLSWESGDDVLNDYQRASLFTGYLAERMPATAVGAITRNPNRGRRGIEEALNEEGLDFEEIIKDYHTTNLLNEASLDPVFQYYNPTFQAVGTIPTQEIDGFFGSFTPQTTAFIEAGAVQYLSWKNVTDFAFSMDTIDPFDTLRERLTIRVLLEEQNGTRRFEDLDLPQTNTFFAGSFERITLIVVHVQAELTSRVGVDFEAIWNQTPVANEEDTGLPRDLTLDQNYPNPFREHTTISYTLPQSEHVELEVYNILGQQVKTLVDTIQPAGNYSIIFRADSLPNGLYLYTLRAGDHEETRRMTIIK